MGIVIDDIEDDFVVDPNPFKPVVAAPLLLLLLLSLPFANNVVVVVVCDVWYFCGLGCRNEHDCVIRLERNIDGKLKENFILEAGFNGLSK